ncbi:MAG: hypothetical protein JWR09_3913 [Mucilaginibacter sp.]|nr:hypothetical protein [Mucilaginibacter sp.]
MNHIGTNKGRAVFYQRHNKNDNWSKDFPKENWLLFVIIKSKDETELSEISTKAIENNACYVCCSGPNCELLHDTVDYDIVIREIENLYLPPFTIMTSWNDNFEEQFWFSMYVAQNDPEIINTIVCLDASMNSLERELEELLKRFNKGYIPPL